MIVGYKDVGAKQSRMCKLPKLTAIVLDPSSSPSVEKNTFNISRHAVF
jgi:hypothetical protein